MNTTSLGQLYRNSTLSRRFTIITVLFLSVLLGLLVYTIVTLQKDKSNALLIDMAGRQRMLLQKHSNEVFLTSQGVPADYASTRNLMRSTLKTLMEGGPVVLNSETNQRQTVPAAPSQEIIGKFRAQHKQVEHLFQLADRFLLLSPDHQEFRPQLHILRTQHSLAIRTADQAVKQLDEYSQATISTMIKWETLIAIVVGLLGMLVTRKGVRDGRNLEKEVEERKRAVSALRENEVFLNSIVENIPNMIFVKTAKDLRFVRMNKAGEELLECSKKEILGKTDYDLFPKEQADFFATKDLEVLSGQKLVDISEEPIQTKSRGMRHLHTKKIPLLDEQEHPQYLLGISEDITEHLEAQESLRRSEARFRSLVEHIPFCIHEIELDGKISSMNQAGQRMIRVEDESQVIGRSYLELVEERDHERIREHFTQAVQGQPTDCEFNVTTHGNVSFFTKSFIPIRGNAGNISKIVGISENITERKRAEERLHESEAKRLQALRQSDDLKSALLSSVSHELRTPLTSMKTSVSNIMGNAPNAVNGVQQEALKNIDQEINYMSRLVDNLLDMSQIEAGTLIPHQEWHPLEDLVEGALRRTSLTLETRHIQVQIPEDISPIFVDAVEVQQVLINLLDNAVKYSSPDSPIRLHVHVDAQQIKVEVSNAGEPLQAQDLERIFERVYRRRAPGEQPIRGTGLGLAISKGIIEAHGGRIWAESIGREVTIIFTIPATESMADFSLEGLHKR